MTTLTQEVACRIGSATVVADADGETFAVEVDGERIGGGLTRAQAVAYAQSRHFDAMSERLFDAANALKPEDPRSATRIEAAIRALKAKPTGE